MSDYPEIVPKGASKARGIDFCGTDEYYYVIRSDLGVYMRSTNFNDASDIKIYSLSEPCRWGDHYLGHYNDDIDTNYFYIIKGDSYRRVKNMNTDSSAEVFSLHPNCRGGSYYYAAFGHYYIVFADRKVYRRVKNMNNDEDAAEYSIHDAFQDGIYFWGRTENVYCLKQADKWGVSYHRSTNMNEDEDPETYPVNESVLNFLPGGLAHTKGKAFGFWDKLKSFKNESKIAADWERTIKETVGFKKREMSSIEHNWSIEIGAQYSSGDLTAAIAKYQFSLKTQYGGKHISTDQQEWSETTEKSETIKLHIPPQGEVYIWQYQMGFGEEKCLFCVDVELTDDPNPPEEPPN